MRDFFSRFAATSANILGSAWIFALYLALIVAWLVAGPLMHYTDSWQLIANTTTTLFTTALCLLIQNTVNTDTKALHLKLDELLRAVEGARTSLVDLEHQPQDHLEAAQQEMHEALASQAQGDDRSS